MARVSPAAIAVLDYWFGEGCMERPACWIVPPATRKKWFGGGADVDEEIRARFSSDVAAAANGELDGWLQDGPFDGLAGIILMDQFTRNVYRNTSKSFAADAKALSWSDQLVDSGRWTELSVPMRQFVLMPYMHSESLEVQRRCIALGEELVGQLRAAEPNAADGSPELACIKQIEGVVGYARKHEEVIAKFGRFPHRNKILGRKDTPEEEEGLANGTIASF